MNIHPHAILVLLAFFSCTWASEVSILEHKILNNIFTNYDKRIRPYGNNGTGPVLVEINTYVRNLNDLDDVKMLCNAQLTFRQRWSDERLKYNSSQGLKYLTLTGYDQLWTPDLFFVTAMKGHLHKIITPNNLIRIYPDGHVLFSMRVSVELYCPMDLRNYPMDKQMCKIPIASYGYTTDDIVLMWKKVDPAQLSTNIAYLPEFRLTKFVTDYCTSRTNTGEYSCVMLRLYFSRSIVLHLLRTFTPTMLLVILSWIPFWLHPRSTTTRMGILIGTLLSTIIITTSVSQSEPRVSYIKASDTWLGTCICFIFGVLIEIALVDNAVAQDERRNEQMAKEDVGKMCLVTGVNLNSKYPPEYTSMPLRWLNKYSTKAQRIDVVSRFLFPAAFIIFNIAFWAYVNITLPDTKETPSEAVSSGKFVAQQFTVS